MIIPPNQIFTKADTNTPNSVALNQNVTLMSNMNLHPNIQTMTGTIPHDEVFNKGLNHNKDFYLKTTYVTSSV